MSTDAKKLIVPPPRLLGIIEKTAQKVASSGVSFETGLKANPDIQSDISFNFLKRENPYYAYYTSKVDQYSKKLNIEGYERQESTPHSSTRSSKDDEVSGISAFFTRRTAIKQRDFGTIRTFSFDAGDTKHRVLIPKFQYQIIALTARFVAAYGFEFASFLSGQDLQSGHFSFLESTHPSNIIFLKLVKAYQAILSTEKSSELCEKLDSLDFENLVTFVVNEANGAATEKRNLLKQKEFTQSSRESLIKDISWDDFHVLETLILS